MQHIASLKARAEIKRVRNDEAAEREHIRLVRKIEREFSGSSGRGGILKRGLARINGNSLTVPAERKRELRLSTSGRSFHGGGTTYSKPRSTSATKGRKRSASSGAAHYRYIEAADQDRAAIEPTGDSHVAYIDGSRVEQSKEGERLARDNIPGTFVERMHFFELAEQFERTSHGDSFSLDPNRADAQLAEVLANPACDPALLAAIKTCQLTHNGQMVKVQLEGTCRDLRKLIKSSGLEPSSASTNEKRIEQDGFAFHSGRSGRTHFRWVFELPEEFTVQQRERVLDRLCSRMDELKCMYAAVIHAPDPSNDARNHHLHLIFYDRPCRRLAGNESDLENVAETFQKQIRAELAAGQIKAGEWDFTVQRHYKSVRTWKTHYPFRAEKSREVTRGKDWKQRFRCEYAAIVNSVSAETGGPITYEPKSYDDLNVDLTPSKHLGQLHQSEIAGIPTLIGLSNEAIQAADQRRAIIATHAEELARLDALDLQLAPFHQADEVPKLVSDWAATPIADVSEARHVADALLALQLWQLETDRERSRAVLVRDRQLRASTKGIARERREREKLAAAAQAHINTLDAQDTEAQRTIAEVKDFIERGPKITTEGVDRTVANCRTLLRRHSAGTMSSRSVLGAEVSDKIQTPQTQSVQPDRSQAEASVASFPLLVVPPLRKSPIKKSNDTHDKLAVARAVIGHLAPAERPQEDKRAIAEKSSASSQDPGHGDGELTGPRSSLRVKAKTSLQSAVEVSQIVVPPLLESIISPGKDIAKSATADPKLMEEINAAGAEPVHSNARSSSINDKVAGSDSRHHGRRTGPLGHELSEAASSTRVSLTADGNAVVKTAAPPKSLRTNALMEKSELNSEYSSHGAVKPPTGVPSAAAEKQIKFEREAIVHIVRIERIRLDPVNGSLALPEHPRIPAEWHRHIPFLQYELNRDQRIIESERKACVERINSSQFQASSKHDIFFEGVFAADAEVKQAKVKRRRREAEQIAQQHAMAAQMTLSRG